ncbi:CaiB/BaiF CoA transferase family protein [Actinomadura sp. SCN-SB]|uniref:CaiB/BaiF CoA transferase family protein n=1 Tax=Actinomadura sp. SCN-SB TaxID=3373092 RepID=UPI0037524E56
MPEPRPAPAFPLDDIRVLDLGQYISGPCAAVLLAEMGADVVKVEPPERGDPFRAWESGGLNATFVAFNRGKRSVVLDLKSEAGREGLLELAADADVLVENFRPGVMARLGLGHDVLRDRNPRLVHCSITGFGGDGPYAGLPAYDGVALGYSGMAGLLLDPGDPRMRGPALADAITGHTAAFAIVAALHERGRSGRGRHLDVSMLGALTHFLHSAVAKKVVEGREEGPYTRPHGSGCHAFLTSDGRALLIHLSSPAKFWEGLCAAVGRPDLPADPRFATRPDRRARYDDLHAELAPIFKTRDRDTWLAVLRDHQVPCAPVNGIGEALADEQLRHLGIIDTVDEPGVGPMPRIRPPVAFDGAVLPPVRRAPYLGEHTGEVLSRIPGAER